MAGGGGKQGSEIAHALPDAGGSRKVPFSQKKNRRIFSVAGSGTPRASRNRSFESSRATIPSGNIASGSPPGSCVRCAAIAASFVVATVADRHLVVEHIGSNLRCRGPRRVAQHPNAPLATGARKAPWETPQTAPPRRTSAPLRATPPATNQLMREVVRVAIRPIRPEAQHHLGLKLIEQPQDSPRLRWRLTQPTVRQSPNPRTFRPKHAARFRQLPPPGLGDVLRANRPTIVPFPPLSRARALHHASPARPRRQRHRPPKAIRLIVRVRDNRQHRTHEKIVDCRPAGVDDRCADAKASALAQG